MQGIPEVPEVDDVNVSQETLRVHWEAFKFQSAADVDHYAGLLASGFELISQELESLDQVFVDTKFEFGYATNRDGVDELIYMDEVGTPDSSRIWDAQPTLRVRCWKTVKKASGKRYCLTQMILTS